MHVARITRSVQCPRNLGLLDFKTAVQGACYRALHLQLTDCETAHMLVQSPELADMDTSPVESSLRNLRELYGSPIEAKECLLLAPRAVFVWDVGFIAFRRCWSSNCVKSTGRSCIITVYIVCLACSRTACVATVS